MQGTSMAVLAFDRISTFHLSVPFAVFGEDRRDAGVPPMEVRYCAFERKALTTSAGFTLSRLEGMRRLESADIVIVPSWRDPNEVPPARMLEALRKAHKRGAVMVGLCLGSYVLAAAGLLDGRPATTHWMWADDLARRYPRVRMDREVLYVDDGDVITSAGGAAGIDCCLHLLRRMHGAEVASRVARRLVVPPHRQGSQAQYIEPLRQTPTVDRFAEVMDWVQHNLELAHTLDSLAAKTYMSRRTFTRRFRQVTGTTAVSWLLNQRLALAQRLLETTSAPVDMIAQRAGFGSEISLRQHFGKVLKTTPSRYRREFRGELH